MGSGSHDQQHLPVDVSGNHGRAAHRRTSTAPKGRPQAPLSERAKRSGADFQSFGAEVTVLNLQDEYVSVIELRFIFPFQQFIDLPGTLLS